MLVLMCCSFDVHLTECVERLGSRERSGQFKEVLSRRIDSGGCSHLHQCPGKKFYKMATIFEESINVSQCLHGTHEK